VAKHCTQNITATDPAVTKSQVQVLCTVGSPVQSVPTLVGGWTGGSWDKAVLCVRKFSVFGGIVGEQRHIRCTVQYIHDWDKQKGALFKY
jgi:hypothetical protein